MMIRSIRLSSWKTFAHPVELTELAPGINVIHGENGAGKSTVVGALVRAAFENHSSDSESTRSLAPWGRSLGPSVQLEVDVGTSRYRVEKQFLVQKRAALLRFDKQVWEPIAEGKLADQKIRELFQGDAGEKTTSSPQHWGISQLLWAPQQQLAVTHVSASTIDSLRSSLESQMADPTTAAVQKACDAIYSKSFSPTGKLKSGANAPAVVGFENELAAVQAEATTFRAKLASYDELSQRIQRFREAQSRSQGELKQLRDRQAALSSTVDRYVTLLAQKQQQESAVKLASTEFKQIEATILAIQQCRQQLAIQREQLSAAEAKLPVIEQQMNDAQASEVKLSEKLKLARDERVKASDAGQSHVDAATYLRLEQSCRDQQQAIDEASAADARVRELTKQLAELPQPEAKSIDELDRQLRQLEQLEMQLESSLVRLEVTAEQSIDVEAITADDLSGKQLAAGETQIWRGSPQVAIRLPGIATLRVRGPATSAAELRVKIAALQQTAGELEAKLGSRNPTSLRASAEHAANVVREIASTKSKLQSLLRGDSLANAQTALARDQAAAKAILAKYPDWSAAVPDPKQLEQTWLASKQKLDREIIEIEAQHRSSVQLGSQLKQQLAVLESEKKTLASSLESKTQELAKLVADGTTDAVRETRKEDLMLAWALAKKQLADATQQLEDLGTDPRGELATIDQKVSMLSAEERQIENDLLVATTQLDSLASESVYSRLAQCEERAASLKSRIEEERIKLDAIKLLRQTMQQQQAQMLRTLAAPIASRALDILRRIGLSKVSSLAIGDNFLLRGVVPDQLAAEVETSVLSSGEQEQVHLSIRLAMAQLVAKSERQVLVLDDVLVATDARRLAAIKTILRELSEQFQVLLLTCHADRYADMAEAKLFDLPMLAKAHSYAGG